MSNKPKNTTLMSLLKFTGSDAEQFLQGQLTNDISTLKNNWQYSGYCNPKGRLLALFILWKNNEDIFALVSEDLVATITRRLKMYIMRSQVYVEEIESLSLSFSTSSTLERFQLIEQNNLVTLGYGDREMIINLSDQPNKNKQLSSDWLEQNILAGLPNISAQSAELFVPQMINLDLVGGISFTKGCYTGQEIVARMHYLGKLKQRMFVCTLNNNDSNSEGESEVNQNEGCEIGARVTSDDKSIGHIVSQSGKYVLAVLRIESVENKQALHVDSADGQKIGLRVNQTQPYSLELKT